MSIKWGYSFTGFSGMSIAIKKEKNERNFKTIAASGYEGVELQIASGRMSPLGRPSMLDIIYGGAEEFKKYLADLKLDGSVVVWDYNPGAACGEENCKTGRNPSDPAQHQGIVDALKQFAEYLSRLGGKYIACRPMLSYWAMNPVTDDKIIAAAECWNKVGAMTAEYGIKPLMHIDWFCAANSRHAIDVLMANTDPKLVGLCLDTAELTMVGLDPLEIYEAYADRVELFHFNQIFVADTLEEYKRPGAESIVANGGEREIDRWFWELGSPEKPGLVDHEKLMASIKAHGYDGWIMIEMRQTPDPYASCMFNAWYIKHVLNKV